MTIRLGSRAYGQAWSCLVTPPLAVLDSHRLFSRMTVSWGDLPYSSGEGLSCCQKGLPCHGGNYAGCVLRGKSPKPGLERTRVWCSRTFLVRACDVGGHVLPGGPPMDTTSGRHPGDPWTSCETVRSLV
jgi:hypothetical protein